MSKQILDSLDRQILKLISQDARIPFLEVARACNVSGAAIHQRVAKLTNLGIIKGSQFIIDPEKIGYETCAYMGLYLKEPEKFDQVVEELKKIPEVVECHYTTGGFDMFIKIYALNNHHLLEIIHDKLQPLGLSRSETIISFNASINRQLSMQMKRIGCLIAALSLLMTLSACHTGGEAEPTLRIGVALYQQEDTFIETVTRELQRVALEKEQAQNCKINLYITDGKESQTSQNEQVDRFLERGYDVICVNIVDRTAAAVIVDKAQAAGVPVIFFNREPVEEDLRRWKHAYYVGLPAGDAGVLQGELVLDAWRTQRDTLDRNGDGVIQYVMLEGEPGHQDALLRTEFCISTLANAGVSAEKLASDAANWQRGQASVSMRQWLQEFGENIEVVFANNDDMALGAIDACAEAGLDKRSMPFIVGVDATPPALEALREGTLKGTVRNDAVGLAESMMELAVSLSVDGEPSQDLELTDERYVWLRYEAVTAESLEDQAVS